MRVGFAVVAVAVAGCSYPAFGFSNEGEPRDTATREVVGNDVAEPIDSAVDTFVADSASVDAPCDACVPLATSCAALRGVAKTGAHLVDPDGAGPVAPFPVYCDMDADGGGWTLALKLDGAKKTFEYGSPLWTNAETLGETSTDLTTTEAKLRSFSTVPFTQLRLGMLDVGERRFVIEDLAQSSLQELFSGGRVTTTLGRAKWFMLLGDPAMQTFCNEEGVNLDHLADTIGERPRVRLGILGNQEDHCASPDSYIGFGAELTNVSMFCFGGVDPAVVVGNVAPMSCGSPKEKRTTTFGYVFVR